VRKIVLFGIPFAGGSAAAIYGKWIRHLGNDFQLIPLELAGHGRRTNEPFHENIAAAVDDMLKAVKDIAHTHTYAFYGHSMGCVLTYELLRSIANAGLPGPQTVFLSGRNPPHHIYAGKDIHYLSDDAFIAEIKKIGGTPLEFFELPSLVQMFLPILRSDYRLIERYRHIEPRHITSANLVFLASDTDSLVTQPQVSEWSRYTSAHFELHNFSGGHFFINQAYPDICKLIVSRCNDTIRSFV
jgi:medium-chain acyl-[acyl-carrier-protein] hydrolase